MYIKTKLQKWQNLLSTFYIEYNICIIIVLNRFLRHVALYAFGPKNLNLICYQNRHRSSSNNIVHKKIGGAFYRLKELTFYWILNSNYNMLYYYFNIKINCVLVNYIYLHVCDNLIRFACYFPHVNIKQSTYLYFIII